MKLDRHAVLRPLVVGTDVRFRWGVMLTAFLLYAVFLWRAWFDLPNPYADEAFFVPPAHAFAQAFSFYSPSLDPHRALHWMPVGYAVLCGLFMKVSGVVGLWGARLFSTVAFGLIFLALSMVGRRFNRLQFLVLHAPFLTMPLLILARLGRMEALFLLVALLSLGCMLHKRLVGAFALALMSGLVHPNGVYILTACVLLMAQQLHASGLVRSLKRVARAEWWWLAMAVVTVGGYGLYELASYASFAADMTYQLHRKARGLAWTAPLSLVSLAVIAAGGVMAVLSGVREKAVLVAWGAALILSRLIGQEIWYSPGYIVGLALILVALVPMADERTDFVHQPGVVPNARSTVLVAACAFAGMTGIFVVSVMVMGWHGARIQLREPSSPGNVEQVDAIVQSLVQLRAQTGLQDVSCVPFEECMLLLAPAAKAGILVRLNNPLTLPPIGRDCIWVSRAHWEPSTEADIRLTAGRITRYEIKPCGAVWPDKQAYEDYQRLAPH